ncbi:pyruvate, phosphate dikinase [bacterium]|nr:pyruvate, phosphate dikinase [candidate division CSSED10-310 bacterium]
MTEGDRSMKNILGGKGANLAEMTRIGIPVPPGFTISTEVCQEYYQNQNRIPQSLIEEINRNIRKLEELMNRRFGNPEKPLLLSVRSGAARSMPGMMDTVLNLGINPEVVDGLSRLSGNRRFALDVYRRFMQMFGDVVMGIDHELYEKALQKIKDENGYRLDTELTENDLQTLIDRYLKIYQAETHSDFPVDPMEQLLRAIEAVLASWNNPRAVKYRELNDIRGLIGTAVNIQTMVYGNLGESSGTGVAFTRNPATGEDVLYGEYLMNAQGEDVVAGIRTPMPIEELKTNSEMIYNQLQDIRTKLEEHYREMQDLEFTIQEGTLYILQTRDGKRTAYAAVTIAVDMVNQGLISREEALMRIDAKSLNQLLLPVFDESEEKKARVLTTGLPASPGAASGKIMFTAEDAENYILKQKENPAIQPEPVIMVRIETSPEDIGGMAVSSGILTARGGMTSHAAVVARGMGICCIAGAGDVRVDYHAKQMHIGSSILNEGDWISLNGTLGTVYAGRISSRPPELTGAFQKLMEWADEYRRLKIRTNADTPRDTAIAVNFGAEGIGLCRTEHMFFEGERVVSFRRLILVAERVKQLRAEMEKTINASERLKLENKLKVPLAQYNQALAELLPVQRSDFISIFKALKGRPATIRTLDPPLHEFLPKELDGQKEMSHAMDIPLGEIQEMVESLSEANPMLGHRGCRLGITYPEVTAMQVRAIIEAGLEVHAQDIKVNPEIMIPLVGHKQELKLQRDLTEKTIRDICLERKLDRVPFNILIGTMIEVPRAALTANEIAEHADFFSFGTNDLTQMGCGFSRDDAGRFLNDYVKLGIYEYDPFQVLDQDGIGLLVRLAVEKGRKEKPSLKIGICGEHGGEPRSIQFCHRTGLDYVSCSPFRVPVARLAAAQAAIKENVNE